MPKNITTKTGAKIPISRIEWWKFEVVKHREVLVDRKTQKATRSEVETLIPTFTMKLKGADGTGSLTGKLAEEARDVMES